MCTLLTFALARPLVAFAELADCMRHVLGSFDPRELIRADLDDSGCVKKLGRQQLKGSVKEDPAAEPEPEPEQSQWELLQ